METTEFNRDDAIEKILKYCRKPIPEIVEYRKSEGTDGNWYRFNGFPHGVDPTGKCKSFGFVIQADDGTTHGKIEDSRHSLIERLNRSRDAAADDFLDAMNGMDDEQIASQLEYWTIHRQS